MTKASLIQGLYIYIYILVREYYIFSDTRIHVLLIFMVDPIMNLMNVSHHECERMEHHSLYPEST